MPRRLLLSASALALALVTFGAIHSRSLPPASADALPAAEARFGDPAGLAVAADGTIYVADTQTNRVRRIAPEGTVSDFAGSGVRGRDDGPAATARFDRPSGLALGPAGVLYVADTGNDLIRAIAANGSVTTVAGSGAEGHTDGPASSAAFNSPRGIAVDASGAVYVADHDGHSIRRLAPDGTVTTLAGSGELGYADGPGATAQFHFPGGLALGSRGELYVADEQNQRIRRIAPDGSVTTFAGSGAGQPSDGPAASAGFNLPTGLAMGRDGTLFAIERSQRVRAIRPDGTVSTLAGSGATGYLDGPGSAASFAGLGGIAAGPDGTLYLSDAGNHRIRAVAADGQRDVRTIAGSGEAPPGAQSIDGPAAAARLARPRALAVDHAGTVYVAESAAVRQIGGDGLRDVRTIAGPWTAPGGVAVDGSGTVYVSDTAQNRIYAVDGDGNVSLLAGSGEPGFADGLGAGVRFNAPAGLAADDAGTVYVADTGNHRIRAIAPDGSVRTLAGTGERGLQDGPAAEATFAKPSAVALAPDGSLYVADTGNDQVRRIDPAGTVSSVLHAEGDEESPINDPAGVAVGADGTLYVADTSGNRIATVDTAGDSEFTVLAGSGAKGFVDGDGESARFFFPAGLAVGPDGTLYVADPFNDRIRAVTPDGAVDTFAGSGATDE